MDSCDSDDADNFITGTNLHHQQRQTFGSKNGTWLYPVDWLKKEMLFLNGQKFSSSNSLKYLALNELYAQKIAARCC